MKNEISQDLKLQKACAFVALIFGGLLLIYMVTQEGEPGAIPLLLILSGSVWYFVIRTKIKKQQS